MASPTVQVKVDNFFSSSSERLDRWRELNAKAQTWAAEARSGNQRGGRAAVEAALANVRALEDFFAYPGSRLLKTLAERIAADDARGAARLVRRISGALLSGSYRYESGQWDTSDESNRYPARIKVVIHNEVGALAQLAQAIGENGGNIENLQMTNRAQDFFDIDLTVEVHDLRHLNGILQTLRSRPLVSSVHRVTG